MYSPMPMLHFTQPMVRMKIHAMRVLLLTAAYLTVCYLSVEGRNDV